MDIIPFRQRFRELNRLRVIVAVLTRHGFGHLASKLRLDRFVPFRKKILRKRFARGELIAGPSAAERVARVLEELGPTFVKLGQMLAGRPDVLPADFVDEFRKLQDSVSPFPGAEARKAIHKELGSPVEELYANFDDVAFASGSIAQAHYARTRDGQDVVVKVRRPDIHRVVLEDIALLGRLAELAENHVPEYRMFRPRMIVDEFARSIQREMDFITEASHTAKFHDTFREDPNVFTPAVRWDLTGSGGLTREQSSGVNLHDEAAWAIEGIDRSALATHIIETFMKQYFEFGLFHADPHPGNLLAQGPA
ncbi:MAG: AarF/UbiB family protein, partial [Phycisphaerae bacterium]|nr:AarF/UbiB family protein [Phycisphaerae bacterium]